MRSTRASAAWAGIALATSFLSVTIIGMQPHTSATGAVAKNVALTRSSVDALSNDNSLRVPKRVETAKTSTTANAAP
jgi:hypothetical protein